jgi:hypothetical protein
MVKPYNDKQGGDIPDRPTGDRRMNLENMPIGELHKRAELLNIPDYQNLNKQQLIEELHRKGE